MTRDGMGDGVFSLGKMGGAEFRKRWRNLRCGRWGY